MAVAHSTEKIERGLIMNTIERVKMVKAMEFICRNLNDEEVLEGWLINGVADGDIEYGDLSLQVTDGLEHGVMHYYLEDAHFADLMHTFLRVMKAACKSGGLYCDNVVDRKEK